MARGSGSAGCRRGLALRVVEAAERVRLVGERRLQRDVVAVDAVAEREAVSDEDAADGPLADVDHVVLEPPPVRVAGQVAAEYAETIALPDGRRRRDREVEPE